MKGRRILQKKGLIRKWKRKPSTMVCGHEAPLKYKQRWAYGVVPCHQLVCTHKAAGQRKMCGEMDFVQSDQRKNRYSPLGVIKERRESDRKAKLRRLRILRKKKIAIK